MVGLRMRRCRRHTSPSAASIPVPEPNENTRRIGDDARRIVDILVHDPVDAGRIADRKKPAPDIAARDDRRLEHLVVAEGERISGPTRNRFSVDNGRFGRGGIAGIGPLGIDAASTGIGARLDRHHQSRPRPEAGPGHRLDRRPRHRGENGNAGPRPPSSPGSRSSPASRRCRYAGRPRTDIGIARPRRDRLRGKPLGVEAVGVGPKAPMPVHDPGHHRDKGVPRDLAAADRVVGERPADHDRQRRVEPHRLVHEFAEIDEARQFGRVGARPPSTSCSS